MTASDNTGSIRDAYDAFARGDVPAVLDLLHPEVEWTEAEGFPYEGTYRGPDDVAAGVFQRLATEWDGFTAEPAEFVAEGDRVVVLGEYGGVYRATGRSFRSPFAHVWRLRDGRVVAFRQFTDTEPVQRAVRGR